MAIYRPRTIGDAPEGLERSGGCCWRDFLASRGMGVSPGEESRADSVAAQTIEAQPVFGQIEPSQRPRASRAEPQVGERMAGFGSAPQEVETIRRRKRNEGRQKTISSAQGQPRTNGSSTGLCGPGRNQRLLAKVFRGRPRLPFELADCLNARFRKRGRHAGGIGSFLMRCGCENLLRIAPDCRARTKRDGFGEDGHAHPCRAANKGRADAGEDLTPSR